MKKLVRAILPLLILTFSIPMFAAEPEPGSNHAASSMVININQAGVDELSEGLSGVGEAKAKAIVEYRDQHGAFGSVEALADVNGIGDAILAANASRIEL